MRVEAADRLEPHRLPGLVIALRPLVEQRLLDAERAAHLLDADEALDPGVEVAHLTGERRMAGLEPGVLLERAGLGHHRHRHRARRRADGSARCAR
ncbi:MAG: hypothetical protein H6705_08675 [Myxococcales bacterium]|nr:hypothetical protein [Myxococcales bacterium]